MRRALFLLLTLGFVSQTSAQVICYVETPIPVQGSKEINFATLANGWTVMPDMTIPANAVEDTLAFAVGSDSLCCSAVTNPANVNGKIAVLYRGSCEFGLKALNAQNAGAVAVIIINNVAGPVNNFGMLGGASGATVNIPVVMITQADGAALVSSIRAGNCVAFIGNKAGFFPNDIGFQNDDYILAPSSSVPHAANEIAAEFDAAVGSWVFNYGYNNQTNVRLHASVTLGGSTLYTQQSAATSLTAGDSLWVQLPTFSQATYAAGLYKFRYWVTSDSADDFAGDDKRRADFAISDTMYSFAAIDTTTLMPISAAGYRPSGNVTEFEMCLNYRDSVGSRMAVEGLYFTASTADTLTLAGLTMETTLYEWNDVFVDLNDAGLAFGNLNALVYGNYTYTTDLQDQFIYVPFSSPTTLQDNQRYLFCVKTFDEIVFLGFGTSVDYDEHVNYYLQPVGPVNDAGTWFALGFGTDVIPALGIKMVDASTLGNEEVTIGNGKPAYPNPASSIVYIPVQNITGDLEISILNMQGQVIKSEIRNQATSGSLPINIDGISNGSYIVRLTSGTVSQSFKIMINN